MFRTFIAGGLAAAALTAIATPALANDEIKERSFAIAACRTAIAAEVGVPATPAALDFRRSQTKSRVIEIRFLAKADGATLGTADCVYQRRQATVAVTLDGALQTRAALNTATASRE